MIRAIAVRGAAVCAVLLFAVGAFGASFVSSQSGNWNDANTWGGAGVPAAGDDVTITLDHIVTVTGSQFALSVTLDSAPGNKKLVIPTGGTLTIGRALPPALTINAPSPGSANTVQIDGGTLQTSNAGVTISGSALPTKLEFTANGGTARFAGDVLFSGTAANAQIDFGTSAGTLEIGGNLGSGGTILNSTASTVVLNGSGAQTINSYTFNHLTVNKAGGTATLNGPITVNGDFILTQGVLDDGGNQISLNAAGTSVVGVGSSGVLKLGSATTATTFPAPHGPTAFGAGSAVVYQAGVNQTIQSDITYDRLYLSTLGGNVTRTLSDGSLALNGELNIANNGANTVTLLLGTGTLDANGDITGNGTITLTTGSVDIAGNWSGSTVLNAGTSTITYDGTGAQQVLGATYHGLVITKTSGTATLGNSATVSSLTVWDGTFDAATKTLTTTGNLLVYDAIDGAGATFRFTGTTPQIFLADSDTVTVSTLEVDNASGVTVDTLGFTVTGALNLLNGRTTVQAGSFFVDVLAIVNRTSGWVVGPMTMGMNPSPARRFHVGTVNSYLPVDVDSDGAGTVTIKAVEGTSPDRTGDNVLGRYWSVVSPSSATPLASLTFNYNQSDVVSGDETKYILAHYDSGSLTFTHYGDANDSSNSATAPGGLTTAQYLGDWIIGQPGSLAAASQLAIISINGGGDPPPNTPFSVVVEAQDDDGDTTPVLDPTPVQLSLDNGSGTLGGTLTGTIGAGADSVTISGVEYDTLENGLILRATRTGGDLLADGTATFNVVSVPSTLTVTSLNDSGPGTLRDAITALNANGCAAPCTIDFTATGTIFLASPLPAITRGDVTFDGFTAPGSVANTNAFGLPSNAVYGIGIYGGAGNVGVGFDVQAPQVTIRGFVIQGFLNAGVAFTGTNTASSNVSGCYIGTDFPGLLPDANAAGVHFAGSSGATAGGFTPASRNVISGNTTWGVITSGAATGVGLYGNYIGVKADLSGPLPNNTGVKIDSGASGANIGSASAGNVISGNTASGLVLAVSNNIVKGNYIGLAGSSGNAVGNATGIQIDAASSLNIIGGSSPSEVNYIGSNSQNGILVNGDDNTIDNNVIGLSTDGVTARGNGGSGIRLENNAAGNLIGTSAGNKIAFNTNDGVTIATTATGIGNAVRKNKIAGNTHRAIDIGDDGLTANDATDADTGANNKQNFPVVNEARYVSGVVNVKLSLDSSAAVSANFYAFDIFKADGSGQAIEYLGSSACQSGKVFVNLSFGVSAGSATVGNSIVATATAYSDAACVNPSEGTSELSATARVGGPVHWINAAGGAWETAANWSPAVVPASGDDAYIDLNGTYTVSLNSNVSVSSLQLGAATGAQTLQIGTGSLSMSSASAIYNNGTLNHGGSGLGGSGTLNVFGVVNWSAGSITGSGGVVVENGGTLSITTTGTHTLNGATLTITANGSAFWDGGAINLANGGAIANSGLFEIRTDNSIADSGFAGAVTNNGTFQKSTTSGTTTFSSIAFNHTAGTFNVLTGSVNLAGGSASAPVALSNGTFLLIDDNTFTLASGSDVTGAGQIKIAGGTLTVNAADVLPNVRIDSGTLNGSATHDITSLLWNGGTLSGTGTTHIPNLASATIAGASAKSLQRTLSIAGGGQVLVTGSGGLGLANGGNIANGGLFDYQTDGTISDAGFDGGINNSGTFRKSGGLGTTAITSVDFTNSGDLFVQSGTLNPSLLTSTGNVTISINCTLLVDDNSVTLNAGDVSGAGLLKIAGGTVSANVIDTLPAIQLDSGTLGGSATISLSSLLWNGGTMSGTGTASVPAGGTVTIAGASAKSLQRTLSVANGGTLSVTGSGAVNFSNGGNVSNDGLFELTSPVTISDSGFGGDINNTRTFRCNTGGTVALSNITLNHSGGTSNVDLVNGSLNLADGVSSGAWTLGSLSSVLIDSHTYELAAGTTVTGGGSIALSAGTLLVSGNVSIPNFAQSGGALDGAGTLTLTGSATWGTGSMQGGGTTAVANGATLALHGFSAKALNNRTLSVLAGGTLNLTGNGAVNLANGGNIANAGAFNVSTNNTFSDAGFGGDFVNTGTFTKSDTGPTTFGGVAFTNNGGVVDLQAGTLAVNSDPFTQNGSGTLKIRLNGTTPGTGHAQLTTNTTPVLAGTLQIALAGLYQPAGGNTFRVVSATSRSGDFTQPYTLPTLSAGRSFTDAWDASGLLLTVNGSADLAMAKSAPSNNVAAGGSITYTLQVTNGGPDPASSITVTDTLPAGHTNITPSGTGWTCGVSGDVVTCTIASLASGSASSITIAANAPATPQTFTNSANVSSANDPDNTNDSANWTITVDPPQADLSVGGTAPVGPVAGATAVTFQFNVTNSGPQQATNVTFTASVPPSFTFNSATIGASNCSFAAPVVTCPAGPMNANTFTTVSIHVTTGAAGTHELTGNVTASESDPNGANDALAMALSVTGSTLSVTNTADAGAGSLRQALLDAQNGVCTPLPCSIQFNLAQPPFIIAPQSGLPPIGSQITIDAATQPGYSGVPLVRVDGASITGTLLSVTGTDSAIRGLSLTNAPGSGIVLFGNANSVEGCWVGLDLAGNAAGNGNGIDVVGNGNSVGGTTAAQRNVLSGNANYGVQISGSANSVSGNYIGIDPAGAAARPNTSGIGIVGNADGNTIGGATAAHRNVLSGNSNFGIYIDGIAPSVVENSVIRNNWIGPNASGSAALPNGLHGLHLVDDIANTTIAGNVISGNGGIGIQFIGANETAASVGGNLIGVAPDGTTPMGNAQQGLMIAGSGNTIGGASPNTIAHNGQAGVAVFGGTANAILGNSMHDNAALGIDLGADGMTPNDPNDADSGSNRLQNFPTLGTPTLTGGGNVSLPLTLDSSGATPAVASVRLEVFEADATGEGKTLLHSVCLAGSVFNGALSFNAPALAAGDPIVATATSYTDAGCGTVADGTSEFSSAVSASACTPPSVTITGPSAICGTGSVTLDAGAGFATYLWSNGAQTRTITLSPTATETVSVTVTTSAGCSNSDTHTVTVNTPPSVTITGPASSCAGGSVTLDAGAGFAQYLWSNGAQSRTITVSPAATETFSVTVTDGNNCQAGDTHTVTVTANPVVTITGPAEVCAGAPVTLDAGPGYATYNWSNGAQTQQIVVSPNATTTYSVTVGNGTCSATDTHTVTVNTPPTAAITAGGATTFCAGGSVTLTASAGTSWLWSNGATTQSITVTSSGTFSVQVSNGTCSATSAPKSVTVHPLPAVNIAGPGATCAGAPVTLDAGPGFAHYLWSNGSSTQTITVSPAATETFSVTVTDGNNCTASDTHTVAVSGNPAAAIVAPAAVCENSAASASVAAQNGATYAWSVTNGTLVSGQGTSAITFSATSAAGVVLSVTVNAGSCTSSGSVTVPVSARPSAAITAPATVLPNQTGLVASVPATAGATYNWSVTNGALTGGQGTSSITFTAGASGTTGVFVTVSTGGSCTESNGHQIFIEETSGPQTADLALTKSAPATVQPGAPIVYTIGVRNLGTLDASGVVITDNFPAGTSFVSMNGGPWNCSLMNAGIRCTGTAMAGSSSSITLTLAAPQQSGTVVNTADVTSATPDANAGNNSASASTSVVAAPPLCATAPPSLQLPAGGASVTSPVLFTWSPVSGAVEYELWINDALAGTTPSTTLTRALGSGNATWFVVARLAAGCQALTSAARTFTIVPAANCGGNAPPQIVAPANGSSVASPVTIAWTAVPNAIGYRVRVAAGGTAPQDAGTTDGATSLTVALPAGSVVVTVDALFSACPPVSSAPLTLTVPKPDPCATRATATAVAPAGNSIQNSSSVTFQWTAAGGASGYRVWFSVDGGTPAVVGSTTSATSFAATMPRGEIVWWVEALYEGCASTESQPVRFTIPARNDCTDTRPELLAPARNSDVSNANVNFAWSAVPGALSYELWASAGNGTPTLLGTTTSTSLARSVPPGAVDWFVRALVDRCPARDSQTFRLTYTPPAACAELQRPTPIEPLDGARANAPVSFAWTAVPNAAGYELFIVRDSVASLLAATTATRIEGANVGGGNLRWFVRARFSNGCSPLDSTDRGLTIVTAAAACSLLDVPAIAAPGQISSGAPFLVQWTPVSGATGYQLQLADNAAFTGAQVVTTAGTSHSVVRSNGGSQPVALYARVRAVDSRCTPPTVSPYGAASAVFILPGSASEGSAIIGSNTTVRFTLPLGAELAGRTFVAVPKQPWLTVTPASGVVAPAGTTLAVIADTTALPPGTSLGGVTVTIAPGAAGGVATNNSITIPSGFSVSLATPVTPSPKDTPPPDALIIPAVAHAGGINSQFQSDVRVSNTSAQVIDYLLTFTPSGDSGITQGQQTQFSIEPGRTIALDDILKTWFGTGNGSAMGTLEIRPLTQTASSTSSSAFTGLANLLTFASSRTFNVTANGTFGQYIPAIPFANFVGRDKLLSLQQIAQSSRYRTNLGIVEGSGHPVSLLVRVFGESGQYLTDFPVDLRGGQHLQLNAFLRDQGIGNLTDGRVEIVVQSGDGLVTAYASVLDNETSDPLLVTPVALGDASAQKWVVPGVADLVSGFANWQTDMRLFNAGQTAVDVTLAFHSQGGGEPKVRTLTIPAGQVRQFDRTLASLFETTNDGGAVHITTFEPAKLIATARTYNQTGAGTYGQFISAVTPAEAAGVGSRPLQLLQVEESERFRSNVGLVEVTGKPVKLEIVAVPPDAKFSAVTELELRPNEFRQLGSLLRSMGLDGTYNARVTVRVLEGEGRVTAYASVIDMQTNDPTYVPAQ